ncbi:carbohydrate binding protein [Klebsormidium nitens]|uniref:Carbohydrate binding protein n=1 Tax=Klebsormidium nitens TaxID=105231 RepID=A0A1Y1HSY7_KLENI|nr:carbohydrate binding protein [Klebsormidium nitens]|eukprot:GAQ79676.1 carbohydrate binding protein [Klebsormidium nitens]
MTALSQRTCLVTASGQRSSASLSLERTGLLAPTPSTPAWGTTPTSWADPLMSKDVVGGVAWAGRAWHKTGGKHWGIPSGCTGRRSKSGLPNEPGGFGRVSTGGGLNGAPPLTDIGWSQSMPSVWQTKIYDDKSSPYISERPTADPIRGETEVYNVTDGDWLRYDNWNLFNIDSIRIPAYSSQRAHVDVRIGSTRGRLIATVRDHTNVAPQDFTDFVAPIQDHTNQRFLVDMKAAQTASRVLLNPARRPFDYCRGSMLYALLDCVTWGNPSLVPLAFLVATYPYATAQTGTANVSASFTGLVDLKLKTQASARCLEIRQTGSSPATWSISELTVFDD